MKPKKYIAPETQILTKKQLATPTYMDNGAGALLTIGDLSISQLRTLLFLTLKDLRMIDKELSKAFAILANIQA